MFRNMVTSLFKYERIQTTDTKAKELRRWADHVITLAKRGDLHARRQVLSIMREKNVAHKLFEEAEKRFGKLNGGYTRIVKMGRRPGDAAPISLIELVTYEEKAKKKKKKPKAAPKASVETQPSELSDKKVQGEEAETKAVAAEESSKEEQAAEPAERSAEGEEVVQSKAEDESAEEADEEAEAAQESASDHESAEKEATSGQAEEEEPKKPAE